MGIDRDLPDRVKPDEEQPPAVGDSDGMPGAVDGESKDTPSASSGEKPESVSMEEHLERLAELNLSSTYSSRSRMSPAIIRLLSAAAGVVLLLMIYLLFNLFTKP